MGSPGEKSLSSARSRLLDMAQAVDKAADEYVAEGGHRPPNPSTETPRPAEAATSRAIQQHQLDNSALYLSGNPKPGIYLDPDEILDAYKDEIAVQDLVGF